MEFRSAVIGVLFFYKADFAYIFQTGLKNDTGYGNSLTLLCV